MLAKLKKIFAIDKKIEPDKISTIDILYEHCTDFMHDVYDTKLIVLRKNFFDSFVTCIPHEHRGQLDLSHSMFINIPVAVYTPKLDLDKYDLSWAKNHVKSFYDIQLFVTTTKHDFIQEYRQNPNITLLHFEPMSI